MLETPFITVCSPGIVHACWRRCSLSVVRGAVTIGDIDRLDAGFAHWMKTDRPGKHVTISYVLPNDSRPAADVRDRIRELMSKWEPECAAGAYVLVSEGLVGSLQRSLLTSILMFSRSTYPRRVFKTLPEAALWLRDFFNDLDPELARNPQALFDVMDHLLAQRPAASVA